MANHSGIADESARLQIVASTRKITVPAACKIIGTVGDHNSEQLTFECPKTIDGHDVLNCAAHYIIYQNADGGKGRVEVHPVELSGDDEVMVFTWTISAGVTAAAGNVSFSVHFVDTEDDGATVSYKWSTTSCMELQVLDTLTFSNDGGGGSSGGGSTQPDNGVEDDVVVEDSYVTSKALPSVTDADNGAFLRVVSGEWAADKLDDAGEVGM